MSFKAVKELRKSGKFKEALTMAKQDLEKDPENIWNKRSIAWVYYEYLKKYNSKQEVENFIEYLCKIKSLELPADEKMIFDKSAYLIGKLIYVLTKEKHIDYNIPNRIFECIKDFHFTKPSEAYSYLYKHFHKYYKNWTNYISFADWWNFDNFIPADYLPEKSNGKIFLSIVERAYIAYSKKLLEGEVEGINPYSLSKSINKAKIKEFLPKLDAIIEAHPEYQYPPYLKTKLLIALGNEKEALSTFLPFAKKKRNESWVWELLADFQAEDKKKMACLCKALSLNTPNEKLVNIRQKLAEILINENKFQEAKTEIEKIISARNDKNYRIPKQITEWTKQEWYKNTQSQKDNVSFYKQYLKIAEEILFADIPEEIVVVEFVNKNKAMLNFIKDKTKHGFFKYAGLVEKPEIGDIIAVRFSGEGRDGFYKALSIRKITDEITCEALKQFSGNLKMKESANFGFVDDVFIDPKLIVKHQLNKDDLIKGKAVLSFNKKRNGWGWKAIKIY